MTDAQIAQPTQQKPLRLWPGVALVVFQWLLWLGAPALIPGVMGGIIGTLGGVVVGLLVLVWWAFFSRAPRFERWGAALLIVVALAVTPRLLHVSIATAGMGVMFLAYAVPVLSLAFVLCAWVSRRLSDRPRRWALVATIVIACGAFTLLRTDGVTSTGADFAWRWTETPEERLLAQADDESTGRPSTTMTPETEAEWPGFRGPHRDGHVRGVRIATDWSASPPTELWRRPVGPAWSSFAVHGDLLFTQEQRGDEEVVACYDATTGEPVWRHGDAVRFWEANAGAGPRGTPTLSQGRVYTIGATGLVNALDAGDGSLVWSRDVISDTEAKVPYWGFSSSPLVIEDVVVVAAAGQLAAYDSTTGDLRWLGPAGGEGYSSPHRLTIDGIVQVLQMSADGAISVDPIDGTLLWEHPWSGYPIVQPALTANGDILLSASEGAGLRRLSVALGPEGWRIEERWTSNGLKPYFNDFVVHDGHAFGFDGRRLACIDLEDGERRWKGGRYGQGQLVLLADQGVLLVLSERGELALVEARPDEFTELARFPAIEGKTWNHPVLVDDVLLVRNDHEMVAFRLSPAGP